MMKNWGRAMLLPALVVWIFVTETVSQSYSSNIGGFLFTSPGLSTQLTRDAAQAWCTNNGSTLLEIKSSYVQTLTVQFLSGTNMQLDGIFLFTNGLRTVGNWNWVNGLGINSITVAGQLDLSYSFGYINLNASSPRIFASIPTYMRGYICQGKFDCSNGVLLNNLCHKSYNSPTMSWFDARNKCLNDGGELASLDFIKDDQGLSSTLNGSWLTSSTNYWIGIRRQWWTWQTSNLEANYTNWMNGRPLYLVESRCLCLYNSGRDWNWIECDCNPALPFVCLTEPPITQSASTSSMRPTTSTKRISTPTDANSNPSTTESQLSTAITMGYTYNRALAIGLGVGLGIGIPSVLIILTLVVVIVRKNKKLSHQATFPTSTTGGFDSVTHSQSAVKRKPQNGTDGTLEMVSEPTTSPYESLHRKEPSVNDQNYQELHLSG